MHKYLLPLLTTSVTLFSIPTIVCAQAYQPSNGKPAADSSLNTQVSLNGNNFDITGGLRKGQTLFHSFTDFSIPSGTAANFNPQGNRDIITRVTGRSLSDINGTLNSNGANFFLINPNGIVFGPNAQLNVGRAFMASTANGINLVNGGGNAITFGTNASGDSLLRVAPNVLFNISGLTMGGGIGQISNFGILKTTNPNQYIGLIGGNVTMNGGQIIAPGGRVELGGLSASGTVNFGAQGELQLPQNVGLSDVSLSNGASAQIQGDGGGNITITARNLEILGGSSLSSAILSGGGTPETIAGDIKLNATGNIVVGGAKSGISNQVGVNSTGQGGNITIDADSLSLRDSAQLAATTFGRGNAGNVKITAKDAVSVNGAAGILSTVEAGGVGKGGNIEITAGSLSIQDGAQLTTITREANATQPAGQGDAGNINVKVTGAADIAGTKGVLQSGIFSYVNTGTIGNAGNIKIAASSFSLRDGAQLTAATLGRGNAGDITVTAKDISLAGQPTAIFSTVDAGGIGKGGKIEITADSLSLQDGAQLATATRDAVDNQPAGQGDAGNINVKVAGVVDITGTKNEASSGIFSFVGTGTVGNSGNINIDTGSFSLQDRGRISASTFGQGNAGTVKIMAQNAVSVKDAGIFSAVQAGGVGKGGNLDITAGSLSLQDGGQLLTITREASTTQPAGMGDAGNVMVKVTGAVDITGTRDVFQSQITSRVGAGTVGSGGNITIDAASISLRDGGQLISSTKGQGNAGRITVNANDFVTITGKSNNATSGLFVNSQSPTGGAGDIIFTSPKITVDKGGTIDSTSTSGNGGNIKIEQADLLLLRRGGQITTNAGGTAQSGGDGGNININSKLIVAIPAENSDITANAVKGRGGNVNINSQGLFGIGFRSQSSANSDITASSDFNQQGTVDIKTPGTDPGKDSTQLPNVPTDASNQISQACSASNRDNKLTVTGRGGLPPNANDPLTSDVIWQDARAANSQPSISKATTNPAKIAPPAVGWVFDGKGKVTLVAATTPGQPTRTTVVCPNVVRK